MDHDEQEDRLNRRLAQIATRIQKIAEIEAQAVWVSGYGARGEMMDEKMRLVDETDRVLDQLEALYQQPKT